LLMKRRGRRRLLVWLEDILLRIDDAVLLFLAGKSRRKDFFPSGFF
jgi:hypothetical protein